MNKSELLKVLNRSKIAVDKVASTVGADCSVVRSGRLFTTNERICIVAPYPEDVSFTVKADTLLNAVKSIKDDEVSISIADKEITVKGGKTRIKISQCEEQISNRIKSIHPQETDWKSLPKEFMAALDLATVPTTDKKMNGVYLEGEYAWSSDGWQINRVALDSQFDPIWLSQKNVQDIITFGGMNKYITENSWLHTSQDTTLFSCRKLDHTTYPIASLKRTLAKFGADEELAKIDDTVVIFDLYESVKSAISLTETGKVNISIIDGELFIEAHCATGDYSNILDVDVPSMIQCTVFARRLVDILSKPGIACIGFSMNGQQKAFWATGVIGSLTWIALLSAE